MSRPILIATIVAVLGCLPAAAIAAEKAAPSAPRGRGALPDSVLAVVAGHREITATQFLRSWEQVRPPARPDSLTPQSAREFLELLVDKELLAEAAGKERWTWTAQESAMYRGLRDRLALQVVLDSVLARTQAEMAAEGVTVPSRDSLGIAARERAIARMQVQFDEPLVGKLAAAWMALPRPNPDSGMYAQMRMLGTMPAVDSLDRPKVLARWPGGQYTVADELDAWYRINPFYRPRVESVAMMRDVIENGVYERELRVEGERRGLAARPDIAAQLAKQAEFNNISHLVAREVYSKLADDSLTLVRFYEQHIDDWRLPLRIAVTRLTLADRAGAMDAAVRLRNPATADSLEAQAARQRLSYAGEITAESDSALFAAAMAAGAGTVVGPLEGKDGFTVARVKAVLPSRRRTFAEARELVQHRWYGEEGERLMRAYMDRLRTELGVRRNDAAVAPVVQRGTNAVKKT
jgi:PPIC-type PPIASE domain